MTITYIKYEIKFSENTSLSFKCLLQIVMLLIYKFLLALRNNNDCLVLFPRCPYTLAENLEFFKVQAHISI